MNSVPKLHITSGTSSQKTLKAKDPFSVSYGSEFAVSSPFSG